MTGRAYLFGRVSQKRAMGSVDQNSSKNLGEKGVARFKGRVSRDKGPKQSVYTYVRVCVCVCSCV